MEKKWKRSSSRQDFTMQLEDLLAYLQKHNIQLIAEGQQIRVRAPKNTITPQISQAIAQNRDQLLMHLHQLQLYESSRQNPLQKQLHSHPSDSL